MERQINNTLDWRGLTLVIVSVMVVFGVFIFFDAYPQASDYFEFADSRAALSVPNFWNVASNALFLVFGIVGLRLVLTDGKLAILHRLRHVYAMLFVGIIMTALGSGWFHLNPGNSTLFWDRLPMTIAFMPLFTVIIAEHVAENLAKTLFWPLMVLGAGSVMYWDYTELQGAGDLRWYGLVQFLPMLLIPAILLLYRSVFDSAHLFWNAIGLYAAAKIFEQMDAQIYGLGAIVSGHSLKHIAASLVPLVLIIGIKRRQLRSSVGQPENQTTS